MCRHVVLPPRGAERAALIGSGALALTLVAGSVVAVVRSFRLRPVRTPFTGRKAG
ncbi:hypothetical protein [Streptomyces sp. KR55]|uniref:hypothetical protein n=1 Tax=Streptomyces sp. KR55 TaxID=3457425 RepID=UPI003FD18C66